jgi:phosphopentomutase
MHRIFFSVFLVLILLASVGWGQMKSQEEFMGANSSKTTGHSGMSRPLDVATIAAQQIQQRNTMRQVKLLNDTNKLLALISSFNQQAAKGDGTLSSEETSKRAAEIEKLARSVKDAMAHSY